MEDRKAIPYPPWWKARAAVRKAELDRAVARLRVVVVASDDIVGALVFGSYASDNVGPESDLDVMVITTEPAGEDPGARYSRIIRRLALGVPCDLIIYEAADFERLLLERPFVTQAKRDGLWIDATASA